MQEQTIKNLCKKRMVSLALRAQRLAKTYARNREKTMTLSGWTTCRCLMAGFGCCGLELLLPRIRCSCPVQQSGPIEWSE